MENTDVSGSSLPSVPSLSSGLLTLFGALDNNKRRIFRKLYTYLWRYLVPLRNYSPLQDYWGMHNIVKTKYNMSFNELALLSWLYQATARGNKIIDSRLTNYYDDLVISPRDIVRHFTAFRRSGIIRRYWHDPSLPYLSRSVANVAVFIQLTDAGVKLVENIERDTYNLIMRSVMREVTTGAPKRKRRKKA
jgi:DNA-binding MarR family transcriptional regulator